MSSTTTEPAHPIIIVTGANNGVGFGICRRLLYNLAQNSPDDARPLFPLSVATDVADVAYPSAGLTLIMACRSRQRAEAARAQLLEQFEKDVAQLQQSTPGRAERVAAFCKNLVVAIHLLDLASVQSTLAFADEVARTYPYVSHLVCNAGVAPFLRISWPLVFRQFFEDLFQLNLFEFVTHPRYNIQRTGIMSDDGLGWAWQCNVFGHYVISRALETKFAASQTRSGFGPARVVWVSSLETRAEVFDADDWQLVKSDRPYEGTKFQTDLVCAELARRAGSSPTAAVRHIAVHPGVVYSLIDAALIGSFSAKVKWVVFYLARWFGSIHHNISAWNGAAAAVHVCLAPLAFIPIFLATTGTPAAKRREEQVGEQSLFPAQLHSVTDRMGHSSVALSPLYALPNYEKEGEILVDRCERLYQTFLTVGGSPNRGLC
ncbi:NAD(P)-binding protein [Lactarius pseudohatsudake]|nr:NAD(P)-binding protein [Lactarius pseudohatsudake]